MHSVPLLLQLTVELVYQFHRVQLVAEQQFFCKTSTLELVHDGVYHLFQALVSDQGCFPIFREVHGFGFYLLGKLHTNRVLCGLGIYIEQRKVFSLVLPTRQANEIGEMQTRVSFRIWEKEGNPEYTDVNIVLRLPGTCHGSRWYYNRVS